MIAIGRLRFDPSNLVLYDGDEVVPLPPLAAQLLAALLRADGGVVSAAWIREALWNGSPVEDRNLNQQMYVLRRALRRDPEIAVEHMPRRGYRLVVAKRRAVRPWPRRFGLAATWVALVLVVGFVWTPPGPLRMGVAAVDPQIALADYFVTSEGPDHLARAASYYRDFTARHADRGDGYGGLAIVDAKQALAVVGSGRNRFFDQAQAEAKASLERDAADSNALTALGIIASVRDRRDDIAQRLFDRAVAADPTGELPRTWRAKFRLSIGDFRNAGCDFRTLSRDVPTSGYALGSLGEWLVLDRDYVNASAVLSQALDLGNHPGFTRYWLARSYEERGLEPQALQISNEVLALYPGEASALALRLRIEVKLGDERDAVADLQRIESIRDPKMIDPIALASADVAMGRRSQAISTLRNFAASGTFGIDELARLRTDPDFDSLRSGFNSAII